MAEASRGTWPIYRRLLGYTRGYLPLLAIAVFAMALDALAASASGVAKHDPAAAR